MEKDLRHCWGGGSAQIVEEPVYPGEVCREEQCEFHSSEAQSTDDSDVFQSAF